MSLPEKVIVITGATSGIGLSLLERILIETRLQFILNICILCRNMRKGEFVRATLLLSHKSAKINLIKMDTGDIPSVLEAIEKVKEMYTHIDYLFLNAGILPMKRLNIRALFSFKLIERLRTGEEVFDIENSVDASGIPTIFATNVLGHFILVHDLMPLLKSAGYQSPSKVIWTTSNSATKTSFSMDDFMCKRGKSAYGSSKYIINSLSMALNERHNVGRVHSCLAEPGLVITDMSAQLLPNWLRTLVVLLFKLLRIFASNLTVSAYNGAEALVWLFKQDVHFVESNYQYMSSMNIFHKPYVKNEKLDISPTEAEKIYQKMLKVSENVRAQIRS